MNRTAGIIVGVGVVVVAFFAGVGTGGAAVGPADTALPPTPTKTITIHDPGQSVTVTPAPVVRVKEKTPQSCRDALTGADRVIDLSAQYATASQKAVQAVIDNNAAAMNKVAADVTRIGSEVNALRPNYLADSAACRAAQ
jgi:cysteine synthase